MSNSQNQRVVSFGCRLNIFESEVIKDNLQQANLDDVVVFNTCAVTKEAERQARQAIRKHKAENPDKKLIVTGCAAQINPDSFADMEEVDQVLGNDEKLKPESYSSSEKLLVNDIMSVTETAEHLVSNFDGRTRAFMQVQNGCNHRCTFCIIPYGRGNSRSVPIGGIVRQAKLLVEQGYQEIVLTGVDVTAYGPDLPGQPSFAEMVKRLLTLVPELPRLRLSSIDVAEIDDQLFEMMAYEERLMPHLHISLQAGNNIILKRMKRRHSREQVIEFCQNIRQLRPEIAFGADIIAGFPTETDEMFEDTFNLIEEAGIQYGHIFPYSARNGTPAARMPQVPMKIRKERAARLRQQTTNELQKFMKANIGRTASVIVENDGSGRSENFLHVQLPQNIKAKAGNILQVKLQNISGDKIDCILL